MTDLTPMPHDGAVPQPAAIANPVLAAEPPPISETRGDAEPWLGYGRQETETIVHFLRRSPAAQARDVHAYERAHRNRSSVVKAAAARVGQRPA